MILSGLQASGKSSFYRERFAATHAHVSKDAWPNAPEGRRQQRLVEEHLRAGRSVVVDTYPTPAERLPLVAIARAAGARVTSYAFVTSVEEALLRNAAREGRARITDVGIFSVAKQLVLPASGGGLRSAVRGAADRARLRRGRGRVAATHR